MPDSDQLLKSRITELARRAFSRECYVYSQFLTIAEQDILHRMVFDPGCAQYALKGGYAAAERRLACFGDEALCGYPEEPPIVCVKISPVSAKFADELTHRDFLGSLMALGVKRSVLGDIIINENCGYLFCLDSVSDFIVEQFTKVKHTVVKCAVTEAPSVTAELPEQTKINIASERLDAVVAAVYKLSRSESQQLFSQGRVFTDSRLTENISLAPATGSIISVRGFGRFIYEGIERETRKGRLSVSVRIF